MRRLQPGAVLTVRAIGGLHVVTLAWDFVEGQEAKRDGLLGFAIERCELKEGTVIERYFLRGIKRFQFKDEAWRLAHERLRRRPVAVDACIILSLRCRPCPDRELINFPPLNRAESARDLPTN